MKQFLTTLSKFGLLVLLFVLINFSFNQFRVNECPKIAEKTIIIGDSHLMTAADPAILKDSRNLAQHAEPYIVSYFKIKKFLACNSGIKHIILGFSPHNIAGYNDKKFTDKFWNTSLFERTYPLMRVSDFKGVELNEKKFYLVWLKKMLLYPQWNHQTYLGQFEKKKFGLTERDVNVAIERHYTYEGKSGGISQNSIIYLDSIIDLARQKQIDLSLVITPLHKDYITKVPKYIKKEFTLLDQKLRKQNVRVLNYMDDFEEDKLYKDYDHLNAVGAVGFSKKLQEDLDKFEQ